MDSMELPSINSTTSISDNPELKNYYEKLLFKNKSGNSLTDLPSKFFEQQHTLVSNNSGNGKYDVVNSNISKKDTNFDFITGFSNINHLTNESKGLYSSPLSDEIANGPGETERKKKPLTSFKLTPSDSVSAFDPNTAVGNFNRGSVNDSLSNSGGNSRRQSIFKQFMHPNSKTSQISSINHANIDPLNSSTSPNLKKDGSIFHSFDFSNNVINKNDNLVKYNNGSITMTQENSFGGNETSPLQNLYAVERRSSYISDSLIHNNTIDNVTDRNTNGSNNLNGYYRNNSLTYNSINSMKDNNSTFSGSTYNGNINPFPQTYNIINHNNGYNNTNYNYDNNSISTAYSNGSGLNKVIGDTNKAMNDNNSMINNSYQRTYNQSNIMLKNDINFGNGNNNNGQYGYLNFVNAQINKNDMKGINNNVFGKNKGPAFSNIINSGIKQINQDNGLFMTNAKQLTSSEELQKIYNNCAVNYFSSQKVFKFIDNIKNVLLFNITERPPASSASTSRSDLMNNTNNFSPVELKKEFDSNKFLQFLSFLKSCNLNYNPKSEAFNSSLSKDKKCLSDTSSYLHYKPLVLVSLKNGKLELLSMPQNSNLLMKRNDLIIIDGDRGKDLALVVEPSIDLNLALVINFLKKKIHFDSLITSRAQHFPNNKFIDALMNSTKGLTDELNPKLYDVIELIQLVVPSKQVLRFATAWEVTTNLHNKFQDELKALHIAQLKLKSLNGGLINNSTANSNPNVTINSFMNKSKNTDGNNTFAQLDIKILNAEFQFDRKKLTFYYICEKRNDFRELIKELFKYYKTRIWLCAIPNNLSIDEKYYNENQNELKMYQDMMSHYAMDDLKDINSFQTGFLVAPALDKLKLDDFQIGVYQELVKELF